MLIKKTLFANKFLCVICALCISLFSVSMPNFAINSLNNSNSFGTYITAQAAETQSFIVNKKTHVFHLMGCSRAPKSTSRNYSVRNATASQLISSGYSPCSYCHPAASYYNNPNNSTYGNASYSTNNTPSTNQLTSVSNSETGDGIILVVIIGISALVIMIVCGIIFRKKKNKKETFE